MAKTVATDTLRSARVARDPEPVDLLELAALDPSPGCRSANWRRGFVVAPIDLGKVAPAEIGELRWDKIEDRLMGLVPHEFKALLCYAPRDGRRA